MANILRVSFDSKDEWPIKDVTVYNDRAQIVRILEYKTTDAGEAELKLTNLPTTIKPESIRAEASSTNAAVLQVSSETVHGKALPIEVTARETEIDGILKNLNKEAATIVAREGVLKTYYENMVPQTTGTVTPPAPVPTIQPFISAPKEQKRMPRKTKQKNINSRLERLLKPSFSNTNALPPIPQLNFAPPMPQIQMPQVQTLTPPTTQLPVINFKDEEENELFEQMASQDNLELFAQALNTYFEEVKNLTKRKNEIQKEIKTLTLEKQTIYAAKVKKSNESQKVTKDISVLINVPEETVAETGIVELKLIYVVNGCSWKANYDVRVSKQDRTVELAYFGQVTNSSTEDWNEVQLYLSTAEPSRAGSLPFLGRANVRYIPKYRPPPKISTKNALDDSIQQSMHIAQAPMRAMRRASLAMRAEDHFFDTEEVEQQLEEIAKVDQSVAQDRGGSATFKLNRLCTIESDSIPHKQKISNVTLTPRFTYVMTPQLTPYAYLMCTARNDSSYIFVKGPMSVFFNGSYVTKSNMKLVNKNQEFKVFLGKDETVKLNIAPSISKKEVTKGGIMTSKTNKETFTRTVKIDNTGEEDIEVLLYEQVPLSRDNKIKVEILKPNVDDKKNRINHFNHLEVKRKMKAGKSWNFVYSYQVEWPRNSEIIYTQSLENLDR